MIRAVACPYFRRAFGWCVPIGGLGGLIELGGGEFRLPVLMYGIGFNARSAVPLNLLTSLASSWSGCGVTGAWTRSHAGGVLSGSQPRWRQARSLAQP
jgi:hypothetical protein